MSTVSLKEWVDERSKIDELINRDVFCGAYLEKKYNVKFVTSPAVLIDGKPYLSADRIGSLEEFENEFRETKGTIYILDVFKMPGQHIFAKINSEFERYILDEPEYVEEAFRIRYFIVDHADTP